MLTTVQSLRARGEPEARDVLIIRPGPWGNDYSVKRYGMRALDLYRQWLARQVETANSFTGGRAIQSWMARLKALAGKRLLCACPPENIRQGACHGVPLAQAIKRLTEVGYELAPGTEKED